MLPKYEAWDVDYLRDPPTRSDAPNIVQVTGVLPIRRMNLMLEQGEILPG